jgi:uncharacterized OB-fold protein
MKAPLCSVCAGCGAAYFPARLRCHRCGGYRFDARPLAHGTVTGVSAVHRAPAGGPHSVLLELRAEGGVVVIAAGSGAFRVDDNVHLVQHENGAVIAHQS